MPHIIVWTIWAIWIVFQLMLTIILINFLIALISQGYEDVMSQASIKHYTHKATLNRECYQFYAYQGWLTPIDCFILQANKETEEENKWKGYTGEMGAALKKELDNIISNVDKKFEDQKE